MKKLLLPFLLLFAFPALAQQVCGLQQFVIEPSSPAWYGEEIDVRMRGTCSSGAAPHSPRVIVNGSTINIELADPGGPTLAVIDWGERVVLGRLLPGTYDVVVRTAQRELGRQTLEVRPRPFALVPRFGLAGERVVIRGVHVVACAAEPCQPIRFGGVPATDVRIEGWGAFSVTVPPHAPGVVDVTVQESSGVVTMAGGFRYGTQGSGDFERVLFPVNFTASGAHGSEWHTEIIVQNNAPVTLDTSPRTLVHPDPPLLPIPTPLAPGTKGFVPEEGRDGGMFFYVPRGAESYLAYSSRIFDRSRSTTDRGAEVPVVRARDTAAVLHLPHVPVDPLFRARLRIYDFDAVDGREVRVTATADDGTVHTFDTRLHADIIVCVTEPCLQPWPAFASIDVSSIGSLRQKRIADLRIEAYERDARLWAFVSVTNNDTQRVTVHTPQHASPE
jgi:hypothetical protein